MLNQILTYLSHLSLAVDLSNDFRCLGLGSKLCLVLSKDCLPIHGILLLKLLDHMVSLALGSKFLSIAGKDSFTLDKVLNDLCHLCFAVDLSNDFRCLGLGSKLCLVLSKDCLPI